MSTSEEGCANDTIVNMVSNLKPNLKRHLSPDGSFDDSFVSPLKKTKHMNISYLASPREVGRMRAELLGARSEKASLENRIKHMHTVRKELQIMYETQVQSLNMRAEKDKKTIEELENQLQTIRKREIGAINESVDLKNKYAKLKLEFDRKKEELEKKLFVTESDKKCDEGEKNSTISQLKRKINELEVMFNAAKDDAESHKALAAELNKRLSQQKAIERDFEQKENALQKAQLYIKELEFEKETFKEMQGQAKSQHHKIVNYDELEKEVIKLRAEVKKLKNEVYNKLVLEEEVFDLRTRLTKYQEQEKTLSALQVSHAQNEMYLAEWKAVARGICESSASDALLPRLLRGVVEQLQQKEITLMSEKVEAESKLSAATHEANVTKSELEKTQKHISELQANIQQSQNLIHRMKKKLVLVTRERDSYRLQLDSYEKDLTLCVNPSNLANPGTNQLATQKERIEELEKIVENYRDIVSKLESDLERAEPLPHADILPVRAQQLTRLQEEIEHLKSDNDLLRSRKDELEMKLEEFLIGDDQQCGRIVHPTNNLYDVAVAERESKMEKLQEEVIKLRRKVKNYEEGLEASKLGDVSICPKDVQSLKDKIKSGEDHIQKLKNYFKSTMQEFRNVLYMLLGYKIDKAMDNQYRLTSMYAERKEDYLCFLLSKDNTLNLMENDFSMSLEDMVQLHLRKQKSIPVFLSSLTLNLFNNRTMSPADEDDEEEEEEEEINSSSDDNE